MGHSKKGKISGRQEKKSKKGAINAYRKGYKLKDSDSEEAPRFGRVEKAYPYEEGCQIKVDS